MLIPVLVSFSGPPSHENIEKGLRGVGNKTIPVHKISIMAHLFMHIIIIIHALRQMSFLSYYVTQCFQHIYLATSTLWGADGHSVFGSDSLEFTGSMTSFR